MKNNTQQKEPIAAIATLVGEGGISVIRVSGKDAIKKTDEAFRGKELSPQESHTVHYGNIIDPNDKIIDEVLVAVFHSPKLLKLLAVVAAVAAAIVEEAFFRRIIMDEVLASGGGVILQVLASGLIFGLAHGIWGIMTRNYFVGIRVMIYTGILGAALAIGYVIGDRSLAPVIVSHFIITATIQPGIVIAAFSGQMPRSKEGWWHIKKVST